MRRDWRDRVIPEPNSGCWLWEGATTTGYGVVRHQGRNVFVHHLAWQEARGDIPPGLRVLHRCGVAACCNPEHLALGTARDANPGIPWQDQVISDPKSGCLLWCGTNKGGRFNYGQTYRDGRKITAHRLVWEEHNGPIPAGLQVLHRCDTPRCVNIDHLFLGTHRQNMEDMAAKGRGHGVYNLKRTECRRGHPFDAANTYVRPNGERTCRECMRLTRRGIAAT